MALFHRGVVRRHPLTRYDTVDDYDRAAYVSPMAGVARLVNIIGMAIIALLSLRFILSLLGANPRSPFAQFIYNLSYPFVYPFRQLFGSDTVASVRFEWDTLVAILVYGFVAWMLVNLLDNSADY